jgi:hypothetical protein
MGNAFKARFWGNAAHFIAGRGRGSQCGTVSTGERLCEINGRALRSAQRGCRAPFLLPFCAGCPARPLILQKELFELGQPVPDPGGNIGLGHLPSAKPLPSF